MRGAVYYTKGSCFAIKSQCLDEFREGRRGEKDGATEGRATVKLAARGEHYEALLDQGAQAILFHTALACIHNGNDLLSKARG